MSGNRNKSMSNLDISLSKSRQNSLSKIENIKTSLVKYTSEYYRGKAKIFETPKNSEKRATKDLSQYLTPKNYENIG